MSEYSWQKPSALLALVREKTEIFWRQKYGWGAPEEKPAEPGQLQRTAEDERRDRIKGMPQVRNSEYPIRLEPFDKFKYQGYCTLNVDVDDSEIFVTLVDGSRYYYGWIKGFWLLSNERTFTQKPAVPIAPPAGVGALIGIVQAGYGKICIIFDQAVQILHLPTQTVENTIYLPLTTERIIDVAPLGKRLIILTQGGQAYLARPVKSAEYDFRNGRRLFTDTGYQEIPERIICLGPQASNIEGMRIDEAGDILLVRHANQIEAYLHITEEVQHYETFISIDPDEGKVIEFTTDHEAELIYCHLERGGLDFARVFSIKTGGKKGIMAHHEGDLFLPPRLPGRQWRFGADTLMYFDDTNSILRGSFTVALVAVALPQKEYGGPDSSDVYIYQVRSPFRL